MTWGRFEESDADDVRYDRLAAALGVRRAEALGLVHTLWARALSAAVDGDLSDLDPVEIERWATWQGAPGAFFEAARSERSAFISVHGPKKTRTVLIEDWEKISEGLKRAAQKAKERKRKREKGVGRRVGRQSGDASPTVASDQTELTDPKRTDQTGPRASGPTAAGSGSSGQQQPQQQQLGPPRDVFEFCSAEGTPFFARAADFSDGYPHLDIPRAFARLSLKIRSGIIAKPLLQQYPEVLFKLLDVERLPEEEHRRGAISPAAAAEEVRAGVEQLERAREQQSDAPPPRGELRKLIIGGGSSGMRREARGIRRYRHALRRGQLPLFTDQQLGDFEAEKGKI